ncbi:uncharacterized protein VP01_1566g12 [Puccinia sorghi]|uniref:Small ribosomal subunit protein mS33 n=1 Tax=Puccinia sorghi TaxID=27349 RepID=A0A0L6VJS3_9BASI|nr:uncharacterized protein VP01_1566g12 [Puccinia sorghi]
MQIATRRGSAEMASALKIPTKFRLQALAKAQSAVFQTPFNPNNLRTGDRYLTKKLKGPLLQTYYPPIRPVNFKQLNQIFVQTAKANGVTGRDLEYWKLPDLREEKRQVPNYDLSSLLCKFGRPSFWLERVAHNRKRGKGPPKKGEGSENFGLRSSLGIYPKRQSSLWMSQAKQLCAL